MTHTLHRMGDKDSLSRDIVFIGIAANKINSIGSGAKLRTFMEVGLKNDCIKIGDASVGNEYTQGGIDKVLENCDDMHTVHVVFDNQEKAVNFLRDLKKLDLGISIVMTGMLDMVDECCKKVGLKRHTVEHSLGIWGRTDKLPTEKILEINTMCGHGMVTVGLIHRIIDAIRKGRMTVEKGAEELSKPCTCGIFNSKRAVELLSKII